MSISVAPDTVAAATRGDAQALSALVVALQRPLYNLSLRMLGSHQDAEEATQEALLRVITHLSSFRGDSLFSTWAWTIATRVVLELRRKRGQRPIPVEAFAADLEQDMDHSARERPEDAVLVQQVKLGCSRAMLQCLDDGQRVAYTLGEILDVPGPQASQALGLSPQAYRKRLSRARVAVNQNLQRMCGLANPGAACRCHKRARPAKALGRLEARDAEGSLSLPALREQVRALHQLQRARALYRADPQPEAPEQLLGRVQEALGVTPS